ncbi:PIG-L deacetylase family protein [Enteractinococcus coprophilus]|uniref:LmbE family N-acetylglucosaminyl deacetylase n=1 Tax=Enteractinococcus coprophilus TaxID=1027633 RepID=A0A543AMI4_9MICC|nr:PIG-L deacetylase family protein [Enteractinococcus coprophilus]TQL73803.1 LmbE family N-acetylglucosaminyl deacetylase [Enteractinococcus coprophilus]
MVEHPSPLSPSLVPLDDGAFQRVLVIVAHPDDAEYGTSAAVAEWTSRGIEVGYVLATGGEAGMQRPPAEAYQLRAAEQRAACDIVGVNHLRILDFPDGMVEYGVALRKALTYEIRAFQPDVLVTGSGELVVPWGLDHPDHRAVGLAAIDASRDAGNRWLFTEHFDEGLGPWQVSTLLLTGTEPTHFVSVSKASMDKSVASLAAHKHYLADLPDHPAPEAFIPPMLAAMGEPAGVPYAMGFAVHE